MCPQSQKPLAPVIPIHGDESDRLHRDMLRLAELARTGQLTGFAYTALTPGGKTVEGILGRFTRLRYIPTAFLGAQRLLRILLALAG